MASQEVADKINEYLPKVVTVVLPAAYASWQRMRKRPVLTVTREGAAMVLSTKASAPIKKLALRLAAKMELPPKNVEYANTGFTGGQLEKVNVHEVRVWFARFSQQGVGIHVGFDHGIGPTVGCKVRSVLIAGMRKRTYGYLPSPLYYRLRIGAVSVFSGFADVAMVLEVRHCSGQEVSNVTKGNLGRVFNRQLDAVFQFAIERLQRHDRVIAGKGSSRRRDLALRQLVDRVHAHPGAEVGLLVLVRVARWPCRPACGMILNA